VLKKNKPVALYSNVSGLFFYKQAAAPLAQTGIKPV
jgi:hypothetical protein